MGHHVTEAKVDGVHRHQAGGGGGIGDHGGRPVAERGTDIGREGVRQRPGTDEKGGGQRRAEGLIGFQDLAGQHRLGVEPQILEVVRERLAEGVEGGNRGGHWLTPTRGGGIVAVH